MAGHPCLILRAMSFSFQGERDIARSKFCFCKNNKRTIITKSGEYWKGMVPARPLYQGVRESVWDPEPSRDRVGDWGGPETSGPSCVLPKGVPHGQTQGGV
jgi:hypothetical protein